MIKRSKELVHAFTYAKWVARSYIINDCNSDSAQRFDFIHSDWKAIENSIEIILVRWWRVRWAATGTLIVPEKPMKLIDRNIRAEGFWYLPKNLKLGMWGTQSDHSHVIFSDSTQHFDIWKMGQNVFKHNLRKLTEAFTIIFTRKRALVMLLQAGRHCC